MKDIEYDYIVKEVEERLANGKVVKTDIRKIEIWLNQLKNSDIPQMKEFNANLLSNYLKKNRLGTNNINGTNYIEIKNIISNFLEVNKDLNEALVDRLKAYMILLVNDTVSFEEKFIISEEFWNIKRNLNFERKSQKVKELIDNKYSDNEEYKSYLSNLIKIINDENKPLEVREKIDVTFDNILKYEKEIDSTYPHIKRK